MVCTLSGHNGEGGRMKTKAHFYVRRASCGVITAEPKDGYIERFGERIYSYDKRGNHWYITDNKTGLFINCFPTLKLCQDYLQKKCS